MVVEGEAVAGLLSCRDAEDSGDLLIGEALGVPGPRGGLLEKSGNKS